MKNKSLTAFFVLVIFSHFSSVAYGNQPKLHICTVASHFKKGVNQLIDSCNYQNIDIDILGHGYPFRGMCQKLIYVKNYIETLPDSDIVMFVDGYDVLILADANTILNKFLEIGHSFIISGERYCWPLAKRRHEFPHVGSSFKYVNSGVYIGYIHALKKILNYLSPIKVKGSDQGLLSAYYLDFPGEIKIDQDCQFFLTLAGVIEGELELDYLNKQVKIKETGITPFAIHGNGGSRPLYQYIYDVLFSQDLIESASWEKNVEFR